jgi:hypothetical protein
MTRLEVDTFEKIQAQIEGLHTEISTLSKKSQNDALNKFKLKFVNQTITDANVVLGEKHKPFVDFTNFDESEIPTNSDCAMMLSQYLSCFEKLRSDNIRRTNINNWIWVVDGTDSDIKTSAPKKLK